MWLQNEYRSAKFHLRGDASRVFLNCVRDIQDSLFQELIDKEFVFGIHDSTQVFAFKNPSLDSLSTHLRIKNKIFNALPPSDSGVNIIMKSRRDRYVNEDGRPGSITGLMAMVNREVGTLKSINHIISHDYDLTELIGRYFARDVRYTDLPENYQLVKIDDKEDFPEGLRTRSYSDRFSHKRYAIYYPEYSAYVFKKIIPQILFSIILLLCTSLAFYVIYQSLQKQRRLTQIKNDFISNVTHELKTPITTVGVAIEAMRSFNVLENPARTQEYLNISKHELNRLSILVDRVLKMALFEQGEPELKMEQINLEEVVRGILNSMKLQFERVSAKIDMETVGNQFILEGDRIHLTSVIYNLIDNALKYSPEQPEIYLKLEQLNNGIQFTVQDHGIGIQKAYQDKIFDKFFRVPTGDQHNIKGHGLGLSYVASVIKKHNGQIKVSSELGKGTSFIIFLPI